MLKKMRWRFIGAAMTAFVLVMLVLLCAVNVWYYTRTTRIQDDTLDMLLENSVRDHGGMFRDGFWMLPGENFWDSGQDGEFRKKFPGHGFTAETPYTTRFFIVYCGDDDSLLGIYREYIASVTPEEAVEYAEKALTKSASGYLDGYRYRTVETDWGKEVVFLNSVEELETIRELLWASIAVAVISTAAVLLLVMLLSKRAIAPYVQNIETQKRFITDASHELKTPLTAISASCEVLELTEEDNEWVANIQAQTNRMTKLVQNLVTLSRLDEEQPFPEKTEFSLTDAVWEVAEPMKALAEAKGKRYSQDIEEDVTVRGDREAVTRMVSILLDNAVRYSDEGGEIRLSLRKQKRKVELTVTNTIEGTIKDPEKLFDRFYRPDDSRSRNTGGTGVGLAVVRATAEAHGGSVSAVCGEGSITFTVTL